VEAQRWERLQSLFSAAIERGAEERGSFLASAAADDPWLRREVEAMIVAHEQETGLHLERRLLEEGGPLVPPRFAPGARVGPYRLVELIGRGGMAEVYLAERDDDQYRQRVALKLIRRGLESAEVVERFRLERQVLAVLVHPNIARLLDGGVTGDGLPYLVMEYVVGRRITTFCAERRLDLGGRLDLFEAVCRAVEHAHRNLIVHRDLKPSNILVAADGAVRLLDFGIAKLLVEGDGPAAGGATRTGARLLTPDYASPEQLSGGAITTATDVYTLGLLLFEMLTGARPFPDAGLDEAALSERVPPRPSSVLRGTGDDRIERHADGFGLSVEALRRRLRGDLDNIVLRALRQEPERRYGSVGQLAEDVRRHRSGLPVTARPDTLGYRTAKFVRRHRWGVAAATAITALLLAVSVVTSLQARALARERDQARSERDRANEVTRFLFQLFEASALSESRTRDTMTLRELLAASESEVRSSFPAQPGVRATLLNLLARVQLHLGRFESARLLAEEGLAERRRLHGEGHPDVAESLDNLATVQQSMGEYDRSEALFRQALSIRVAAFGHESTLVAETMNNLSGLLGERGAEKDVEEEGALQRESLAIQRRLLGNDDLEVARGLNNLGVFVYHRKGKPDLAEAGALFGEALAIRRRQLGSEHPIVANTLNNLANVLHDQGHLAVAEERFREAIRIWTSALGPDHPQLASGYAGLSELLEDRGDIAGAIGALSRSIDIDAKALPAGHRYLLEGHERLERLYAVQGRQQPPRLRP
jgi:serine/threonine-protein kinase